MFTKINWPSIISLPTPLLVGGRGAVCSTVFSVDLGRSIYLSARRGVVLWSQNILIPLFEISECLKCPENFLSFRNREGIVIKIKYPSNWHLKWFQVFSEEDSFENTGFSDPLATVVLEITLTWDKDFTEEELAEIVDAVTFTIKGCYEGKNLKFKNILMGKTPTRINQSDLSISAFLL